MSWITGATQTIGFARRGDRSGRLAARSLARELAFRLAFLRKLDRDVGRCAHHTRASVGMGLAVEQCLENQKEFFRKHGRSPRRLMSLCRGIRRKIRSIKSESRAMAMLRRGVCPVQSGRLPALSLQPARR